jgi:hypothetical protein
MIGRLEPEILLAGSASVGGAYLNPESAIQDKKGEALFSSPDMRLEGSS